MPTKAADDAFNTALKAALAWMEKARTTDFAEFTEGEARGLFAAFLTSYQFSIIATWDAGVIRTIATPFVEIDAQEPDL